MNDALISDTVKMWTLVVAVCPVALLVCYGLYRWAYDIWEARVARTCPILTITSWRVTMYGTDGHSVMYEKNDHQVPDAWEKARQIYDDLVECKKNSMLWYTKSKSGERVRDLNHISNIEIRSYSDDVRVLPDGRHRTIYT